MTDPDLIRRSVTAGDHLEATPGGGLTVLIGPASWGGLLEGVKGATGLPHYASRARDLILQQTYLIENMWAGALNTAITKQTALGWRVDDPEERQRRISQGQQIVMAFDGAYVLGLSRHLRDYLTTDNGAFVEVVRASRASGSKILGLMHLDSTRCYRTGDPRAPVMYMSYDGGYHLLRAEDVLCFADMPSPRLEHRGYGFCAASRAFETILKLTAIETYVREKVSGSRNLAIHLISGISDVQLREALSTSGEAQNQRGFVLYRGSTLVPLMRTEAPAVVTIPLAELPDGFDADLERKDAYLRYANALGVFVGEIQPLSGQGLGTGQQTVILDEAAEGRGLASWRKLWQHMLNQHVLPRGTTFHFATNDTRDNKAKADVTKLRVDSVTTLVEKGVLTAEQALNMLVDWGEAPREFLPQDQTNAGTISDEQKPLTEVPLLTVRNPRTPDLLRTETKARRPRLSFDITDDVIAAARTLRQEARNEPSPE